MLATERENTIQGALTSREGVTGRSYSLRFRRQGIANPLAITTILCSFLFVWFQSSMKAHSFSLIVPNSINSAAASQTHQRVHRIPVCLHMSSTERITTKTTKKGTQVIDKTETKVEEKKNKEEMWRVVLHNDEVHTFNYVVRSLTKVIGTLDRKAAFEICVQTHGIGKATITKTWKKQAEQFCLGLQRQGLTVSISPDEDFEGGHSGGGI